MGHIRIIKDEEDICKLVKQLEVFNPFGRDCDELVCILTNDVASSEIKEDLLTATVHGNHLLKVVIEKRLEQHHSLEFWDTLPKNKSKTFESLHSVQVAIKSDRDLFRRLLTAPFCGRDINILMLLTHELSPVPLSLATLDRNLRLADKALLSHLLVDSHNKTVIPPINDYMCVLVDAMLLVQAMNKPTGASTFGKLANS